MAEYPRPLHDTTAVVTGASRGLGAVVARRLARDGARVVVNYRANEERARSVVDAIESEGGTAIAVQADVTIEEQAHRLIETTWDTLGPAQLLVNNAGILTNGRIADMSADTWDEMMTSHLRGAFLVTREWLRAGASSLPLLPGRRVAGKIINMSSGIVPAAARSAIGQVHYLAAKSGLEGFTRGLAGELSEQQITVNMVRPGIHFTDMAANIPPQVREELAGLFLLGLPVDEDVAASVAFFLSPDADHLTGECLKPNGGSA